LITEIKCVTTIHGENDMITSNFQ